MMGGSRKASAVLVQPLLDHDADRGGGEAENQAGEPQRIEPYSPARWRLRGRNSLREDGLSRVDEGRVDGKRVELRRDLLQCGEDRVRRCGCKKRVGLDNESGKDCRE